MGFFQSKEEKRIKREVAIRTARKKLANFINDNQQMARKYLELARRAGQLGEQGQCDQYLYRHILYTEQSTKWGGFLLKMEDLILRGQMATTMTSLVAGLKAFNEEMNSQAGVQEMVQTMTHLQTTMDGLHQSEEKLSVIMEGMDDIMTVDGESTAGDVAEVPTEKAAEIARLRSSLQQEAPAAVGFPDNGEKETDQRIQAGLARLKKISGV